jgi:hypothetical protein
MYYLYPFSELRGTREEEEEEKGERRGTRETVYNRILSRVIRSPIFHQLPYSTFSPSPSSANTATFLPHEMCKGTFLALFFFLRLFPLYIYIYIYIYIPLYIYSENNSKRIQFGCHAARWKKIQ